MMIVRDLSTGPRRTLELLSGLHPISSRTLVGRLRDLEHDGFLERRSYGARPPHVEYALTDRGELLLPLLDALRTVGESLNCNECEDHRARFGSYCDSCPRNPTELEQQSEIPRGRKERDDSIVLL
jgi:DNA-binding HxlR family transcriptional regulator